MAFNHKSNFASDTYAEWLHCLCFILKMSLHNYQLLFTDFGMASYLGAKEQVVVQVLSSLLHSTCLQSAVQVYLCGCWCVCTGLQIKCEHVNVGQDLPSLHMLTLCPSPCSSARMMMMMVSDDCLVECKIDDDSDEDVGGEEQINTPPPPPEFASKAPTPASKPPTPPPAPATPTPTTTPTPTPTCPVNRDPYGINQHLKVPFHFSLVILCEILVNVYFSQLLLNNFINLS